MFKTGTSQIVWALYPLVPLYRRSPRKRPTWQLKNKFNPSLPDSTKNSNSFKTSIHPSKAFSNFLLMLFRSFPLYIPLFISRYLFKITFHSVSISNAQSNIISQFYLQSFSCQQNKLNSLYFCHLLACYTVNLRCFKFYLSGSRFI